MKRFFSTALLAAALLPLSVFAASYTFTQNTGVFTTSTGLAHGQAATWGLDGTMYTNLWNATHAAGQATTAKLTLTGIFDWTTEANDSADALFIHLLSGLNAGVQTKNFDNNAPSQNNSWSNAVDPFIDNTSTSSYNYRLQNSVSGYTGVLPFTDAVGNSLLKNTDTDQTTAGGTPAGVSWTDKSGTVPSTVTFTFTAANMAVLNSMLDTDAGTGSPYIGLGFAAECHYYMTSASLVITVPDSGSTVVLMGLGLAALVGFRRSKK